MKHLIRYSFSNSKFYITNKEELTMSEERQKVTLTATQKEKFNGVSRVDYKSSVVLAQSINSIFKDTFKDYNGCAIEIGNPALNESPVIVIMDFIPTYDNGNDAPLRAFKAIGESDTQEEKHIGSVAASVLQHNQMVTTKETYEITRDAIDIIHPLLIGGVKGLVKENPKAYRDRGVYVEGVEETNNIYAPKKQIIHEYIRCVDIEALLKLMLPEKNEEGNKVVYTIATTNVVPDAINNMNMSYIFSITQHDLTAMNNIINAYGRSNANFQSRIIQV